MSSVPVTVTSAVKLTTAQRKDVEKVVEKKVGSKDFELNEVVDQKVIGGVSITVASRQYDATVANRMNQLRERTQEE